MVGKSSLHWPVVEVRNRPFSCDCGRKFVNSSSLGRHVRYECGKEPSFRCPFVDCASVFYHNFQLKQHLPSHKWSFKCWFEKYNWKSLELILSLSLSLSFDLCIVGMIFLPTSTPDLPKRKRVRLPDESLPFVCRCGRRYALKGSLLSHMRLECGKEPSFHCPLPNCDSSFHRKHSLERHHLRYHGTPLPSSICSIECLHDWEK